MIRSHSNSNSCYNNWVDIFKRARLLSAVSQYRRNVTCTPVHTLLCSHRPVNPNVLFHLCKYQDVCVCVYVVSGTFLVSVCKTDYEKVWPSSSSWSGSVRAKAHTLFTVPNVSTVQQTPTVVSSAPI